MKEKYLDEPGFEVTINEMMTSLTSRHYRHKKWKLYPSKAALLVLDMQNYFLDPKSHAFTPSAPAIVPNINRLIDFARKFEMPSIFTRHVNNDKNAGMMGKWWRDVLIDGSHVSEIHKMIRLYDDKTGRCGDKETGRWGESRIIVKNQYDAFYDTDLEEYFRSKKVEQVIITGVLANLCCETTARSAFVRGFEVFLPVDATAAYNLDFHLSTFRNLGFGFCPVLRTSELINSLNEPE